MKVAILPVDSPTYPNLALMKIARYYLNQGATVDFYNPFDHYDILYMSKIFTFTPDYPYYITNADQIIKGGTGYDYTAKLPTQIDALQPYYDIYNVPKNTAYGFLTRGCVNNCKWCVVPKKEGFIKPYMDVEEIAIENRTHLILMDNNILASNYGYAQLDKIIANKIRVDFNQGLDARRIDFETAKILARVNWLLFIRIACDTSSMVDVCLKAIDNLRRAGFTKQIFIYMLINSDINESYNRIRQFRGLKNVSPFAQPYRDFVTKAEPPQWQKDLARWCNRKELFASTDFPDFYPRKNFKCSAYFR